MVVPDNYRPLADETPGCALGSRTRNIQNGSEVYSVSLNQDYLRLLGLLAQGAPTVHAVAASGQVLVERPAYIIQPAEVDER
jgi:hypothetical protein